MPSTVIAASDYDAFTSTLRIIFVSGMIYYYENVPEEVYLAFKRSGSKGIYFNRHIKDRYPFKKIK